MAGKSGGLRAILEALLWAGGHDPQVAEKARPGIRGLGEEVLGAYDRNGEPFEFGEYLRNIRTGLPSGGAYTTGLDAGQRGRKFLVSPFGEAQGSSGSLLRAPFDPTEGELATWFLRNQLRYGGAEDLMADPEIADIVRKYSQKQR